MTEPTPQSIHVLTIDPRYYDVVPARALDMGVGRESVASLAKRHQALAAINGGFFLIADAYDGTPQGVLKIEDKWYGLSSKPRGAFGWDKKGKKAFDRLLTTAFVDLNGTKVAVDGLNKSLGENEAVLFSSAFGFTTLTSPQSGEISMENGSISHVSYQGSTCLPSSGWILSVDQEKLKELPQSVLQPSSPAFVHIELAPQLEKQEWNSFDYILGGCPLLIYNGKKITDFSAELTTDHFLFLPHPRTAVGILNDGKWIFVVVDGRQPQLSVGMTIPELATYMESLGCVYALNLDGGRSSTLVYNGNLMNHPAKDEENKIPGLEMRKVSDALLVLPKQLQTISPKEIKKG